jgi:hypothetical protein
MIILEGMDGTGKTTLFHEIARAIAGFEFRRQPIMLPSRGAPQNDEEIGTRLLEEQRYMNERFFVTDRSELISQFVYGGLNVDRRIVDISMLQKELNKQKHLYIYCAPFDPHLSSEYVKNDFKAFWLDRVKKKYFDSKPICKAEAFEKVLTRYDDVNRYALTPDIVYCWKGDEPFKASTLGDLTRILHAVTNYLG